MARLTFHRREPCLLTSNRESSGSLHPTWSRSASVTCRSRYQVKSWTPGQPTYPRRYGYEWVGEVEMGIDDGTGNIASVPPGTRVFSLAPHADYHVLDATLPEPPPIECVLGNRRAAIHSRPCPGLRAQQSQTGCEMSRAVRTRLDRAWPRRRPLLRLKPHR